MMELRNFPCSVPSAVDSIATVDLSEIAAVEPWVYWRDGAQQPGSHVFLRGGGYCPTTVLLTIASLER